MMDLTNMKEVNIGGINLKELYINNTMIWKAGILPIGYTQLDYIEADGTNYLDTGVNCSLYDAGIRYYFKGSVSQYMTSAGNNYLWGCFLNGSRSGNPTLNTASNINKTYVIAGKAAAQILQGLTGVLPEIDEVFEYWLEISSNHTENGSARYKTTSRDMELDLSSIGEGGQYNIAMPNGNVYLGWVNGLDTATKFNGRFYSFTMADVSTGSMLREFIPCINPEGKVGMYDLVSKTFFDNAGGGAFTAGNAV